MKRFAVLLLALAMMVCCALPAFAAGTIEVTEDVSANLIPPYQAARTKTPVR